MSFFQDSFTLSPHAQRVRFGAGLRHHIRDEIARLGKSRALVLTTPQQVALGDEILALCGDLGVGHYPHAVMHTPVDVSQAATAHAVAVGADVLIAAGGGSTTGLGKAIALRTGLDQIVIPTTYAGSEATPVLGQTENGRKTTQSDPAILPEVILYDAELVTGLPAGMTVTSALNALAHAAEGLYARDRSPLATLMAVEAFGAFTTALPKVLENPADLSARGETLYGAWLCGTVLGQVGMALHHKLCHVLGGSFNLPHAETHAVILPHALAYNAQAAAVELAPLQAHFGPDIAGGLYDFAARLGAPQALRDLGLQQSDLDQAADIAVQNAYWNPRPVTRDGIRALLGRAWEGARPTA